MLKVSTDSFPGDAATGQGITVLPLRALGERPDRGVFSGPGSTDEGDGSDWGFGVTGARAGRGPQTTRPNKPTMSPSTSSPKAVWIQRFIGLLVGGAALKDRSRGAGGRGLGQARRARSPGSSPDAVALPGA